MHISILCIFLPISISHYLTIGTRKACEAGGQGMPHLILQQHPWAGDSAFLPCQPCFQTCRSCTQSYKLHSEVKLWCMSECLSGHSGQQTLACGAGRVLRADQTVNSLARGRHSLVGIGNADVANLYPTHCIMTIAITIILY